MGLLTGLSETVTPWILGTLLLLILLTMVMAVKAWRDMKRSPYFFLRRQAENRLQTYSLTSFGLILAALFIGTYAWQPPQDTTLHVAILTNAKPPKVDTSLLVDESTEAPEESAETADSPQTTASDPSFLLLTTDQPQEPEATAQLPPEFDQYEPTAELKKETDLGTILFSTAIDDNYEATNPANIFPEGAFTVYATFSYEEMANGMEWAWVWKHNGEVVGGGNELWSYGDDGPGYVYFSPEEGFQSGNYTLEVWVNGELLSNASLTVNSAAIQAGN